MGTFTYETQGTSTYLVYAVGADENVDSMSLGMITNNSIPGFTKTVCVRINNQKFIKYNVSSKIPAVQVFSGAVNKKRLIGVLTGVITALQSAEEYMIDPATISLNLDQIYFDVSTCETLLICLPVAGALENCDIKTFLKKLMFSTQFDQTENCNYVAKIINYLNSSPNFSLEIFSGLLKEISNEDSQIPSNGSVYATPPVKKNVNSQQSPANKPVVQKPVRPETIAQPTPVSQPPVQTNIPNTPPRHNVAVPVAAPKATPENADNETQEEAMSLFYLLQHYNKENAELYKAQKKHKNNGKSESASAKGKKRVSAAADFGNAPGNFGFSIPGQPATPANTSETPASGPIPSAFPPKQQPPRPVSAPAVNSQPSVPQQAAYTPPKSQPAFVPPVQPQGQGGSFGDTTVLGGGAIGETTVLSAVATAEKAPEPCLVRVKNNERIPINKPVFRIGKERSYVDYFISDNTAISRSHANIVSRDGEYYVVDTNSTNHTFVNGAMLQSNAEIKINNGDKIRLANEDFDFRLY